MSEPSPAAPDRLVARILVVESEPVIAADIENVLVMAGHYVVGIAATAREAVDKFAEHQPDLVISELRLADREDDGFTGLKAVQEMLGIRKVPTLFVTAWPERLLTSERPEPALLVVKPFDPRTITAAVSQALTGKQPEALTPAESLRLAATSARRALEGVEARTPAKDEDADIPFGHNGPPPEHALSPQDIRVTIEVLHRFEQMPEAGPPDQSQLTEDRNTLTRIAAKIAAWVTSTVADGFLKKVGENLADWKFLLGAYVLLSGHFDRLLDALDAFVRSLGG